MTERTKVVHCKKEPYDVYIGRPSKWGNPYKVGKDGDRQEVIEKYIETTYPNSNRLELFARETTLGWDVWGDEV